METINRQQILDSAQYWVARTQISLFRLAVDFMHQHNMNRKQLAEYLGVTPGYVTQLLNGDYDHRLSKFFELALAFGVVPEIKFTPVQSLSMGTQVNIATTQTIAPQPRQHRKWAKPHNGQPLQI